MPALVTKTIRLKAEQDSRLRSECKERSSYLMRELLRIYWDAKLPGQEILTLRHKMMLSPQELKKLEGGI